MCFYSKNCDRSIDEKIEKLGYELYDVEYAKERKKLFPKSIYR